MHPPHILGCASPPLLLLTFKVVHPCPRQRRAHIETIVLNRLARIVEVCVVKLDPVRVMQHLQPNVHKTLRGCIL